MGGRYDAEGKKGEKMDVAEREREREREGREEMDKTDIGDRQRQKGQGYRRRWWTWQMMRQRETGWVKMDETTIHDTQGRNKRCH